MAGTRAYSPKKFEKLGCLRLHFMRFEAADHLAVIERERFISSSFISNYKTRESGRKYYSYFAYTVFCVTFLRGKQTCASRGGTAYTFVAPFIYSFIYLSILI